MSADYDLPSANTLGFDQMPEEYRRCHRFGGRVAARMADALLLRRQIDAMARRLVHRLAAHRARQLQPARNSEITKNSEIADCGFAGIADLPGIADLIGIARPCVTCRRRCCACATRDLLWLQRVNEHLAATTPVEPEMPATKHAGRRIPVALHAAHCCLTGLDA